ncbi:flagellar motor switch protein FliM [Anaerobacterium chartisolvens]|uniref:Flagellar motor switch protein FliM n=1 Tax=Anaerobacterium chartisolvens TaxID=1297424 RepID=A0A369B1H4_9FIRM|nr:flagellar motor switch protein FliM [Anaerobacterium chartisolvens]RCX15522.1 flagellar motor switch protein FliM [Anaerobacterium chartisolvens]
MGDILSQNEIDELLKALNTGEIDVQQMQTTTQEKKIRSHDFRRPSKFAKDHIKTLQIINDTYARLITNFLSGYLRTLVQVEVANVEAVSYYEFNNSISNPVVLAVVDFTPLSGSIIFEISPAISFALVDRILGGKGTMIDKVRGFTEIELAIIERIIIQILNLMKEPWENVIAIRPRLEKIETNAQFAQIISPNEMVALVTFNARIGEVEGMINICIPHMVVEPIISKLSTRFWFSTVEKEIIGESKELIEVKIKNTVIPIKAVLGRTTISVNDFIELQPGDVLPLDSAVNGNLEVLVGDLLKFYAKPGVRKNKTAVKITDVVKREDE